jgi:heat shock protein HslJ
MTMLSRSFPPASRALVLVLLPLLLLAGGCGSKEVAPPSPEALREAVVGKTWIVHSLGGRSVTGDEQLTLALSPDGTVSGTTGCGTFGGTYVMEGTALHFDSLVPEEKSCGPVLDEQRFSYLSFLRRVNGFKLDGDDLSLTMEEALRPLQLSTSSPGLFW